MISARHPIVLLWYQTRPPICLTSGYTTDDSNTVWRKQSLIAGQLIQTVATDSGGGRRIEDYVPVRGWTTHDCFLLLQRRWKGSPGQDSKNVQGRPQCIM